MADGKPLRRITTPEIPGIGHAWAYLPDLAETIARLAAQESALPTDATFHFGGHFLRGQAMAEAVRRANGNAALPIRGFLWPVAYLARALRHLPARGHRNARICGAKRSSSTMPSSSRCWGQSRTQRST